MTAIAGKPDIKHMDRWFATSRLRTEGTEHLLAAADATGVSQFIAQSYASWNGIREGGWVKTEEDPLDPMTGKAAAPGMAAISHVDEVVVKAGGAALRYGGFYGPGATDDQVELVRKRQFPLVGSGAGYSSWVHLDDAASATVLAVVQQAKGIFNIVDDEPAPASEWLPYLAECAGAKPPMRVPKWLARLLAGQVAVTMILRELLAADVQMIADGGGKTPQWGKGVNGADNVARVLSSTVPWFVRIGGELDRHLVNGQPGAIFRDRDNKVLNTWTLDILDGRIQTIRTVLNPDKLGHVGPVADAWAVIREANQTRRDSD